ncbi:MAG: 3-oxoacyl-[acyl-carrier-protein] reductase [Rickettsiales bacterium]|nr:3-oxoacyl-[acyl-carrier-protein] reductase [Rickettsiales bacterium]|tara:strand:+ start:109862 stop:110602 length:741 start_codon:yes stop_codon:yes gene_type:complete
MFDLTGKKALVTGATGGIGGEIVRSLVQQGATVVMTGRRQERLDALAQELPAGKVHSLVADLSNIEDVKTVVPRAIDIMGGIDILVNNAGITRDGLSMRMKENDFDDVLAVNLKVPFLLSQAVTMPMIKAKGGRIINISSIVGVTGNPGQVNYCSAKAGLIGQTKSLAQELASRSITVNAVAPGFIATEMTDALNDTQRDALLSSIPAQKMGTPKDIAAAVVYLASEEAGYVTGQTLHVNGGLAMI